MDYIKITEQYGSVLGLKSMKELLNRLSNPQNELKFVHIAGTNGKGSVSSYVATILAAAGYKVGRYISPVIFTYCERIQICEKHRSIYGSYIEEDKVAYYMEKVKEAAECMVLEGYPHPTVFEIETALSFLYFLDKKCHVVVLEAGLGGRLDATNVTTTTICSVLTSISMDHMDMLGNTLEDITREKVGIIKPAVPVVSYEQKREVAQIIEKTAKEMGSELVCLSFDDIQNVHHSFEGITFDYKEIKGLQTELLGENQVKNGALAIEVCMMLRKSGYHVDKEHVIEGIKLTKWPGRFQLLSKNPYIFIDGAHNEDGAKSLAKSIELYFSERRLIYVMGVFADKDYTKILEHTAHFAQSIIAIATESKRALPSAQLWAAAKQFCKNTMDGHTVEEGLKIALKTAEEEDVVLIFGSLSFIGEVFELLLPHSNFRDGEK